MDSGVDLFELDGREALRLVAVQPWDLSPEQAIARTEVLRVLKEMPRELSSVAMAIGVLGHTQLDVAERLNVNQSSVSRRWKRALEELERGLA
jgi:DNA-directed RNA polymerase specialized sigma24 family protein